jgi:hypothetical protein
MPQLYHTLLSHGTDQNEAGAECGTALSCCRQLHNTLYSMPHVDVQAPAWRLVLSIPQHPLHNYNHCTNPNHQETQTTSETLRMQIYILEMPWRMPRTVNNVLTMITIPQIETFKMLPLTDSAQPMKTKIACMSN